MLKWILSHKKGLLLSIAALLGCYVAVTSLVPGDQKEAQVGVVKDKIEEFADKLPADEAAAVSE